VKTNFKRLVFVILGLLLLAVAWNLRQLIFVLLFGWVSASVRLWEALRNAQINWLVPAMALCVLTLGVHRFLNWMYLQRAADGFAMSSTRWRWRWTLGVVGGVWLVLLSVMSLLGMAHQSGWILVSKEPIFVRRGRIPLQAHELRNAAMAFDHSAQTNAWNIAALGSNFWTHIVWTSADEQPFWEKYSVHLLEATSGTFSGAFVLPRDGKVFDRVGGAVVKREEEPAFHSASALIQLLRETQTQDSRLASNVKK
jgi:hypothetical protein